jgi:hypothetical protein
VTSLSRMPVADPKYIKLQIDAHPCFAAAAGGAVRYLAESSGMTEEVCREIQQATVQACLEAFQSSAVQPHIIELSRFEDRIEVVVDSKAGAAAIHLTRPVASPG